MTMPFSRYTYIRDRILELYNILNNRTFPIWIAPRSLMTIDQLRERFEYQQEGFANDTGFYETQQLRQMKIPQMLDILENLTSVNDLGFGNANKTVIEIYESIQEYIRLWCEIITSNTGFSSPPRTELRLLESLAYILFPIYKSVKVFTVDHNNRERFKEDQALNKKGLVGFAALFAMPGMSGPNEPKDYNFISHLDNLETSVSDFLPSDTGPTYLGGKSLVDSIARVEMNNEDNTWIFRG